MKINKWTLGLAAAGVVSLGSIAQADEHQHGVLTSLSTTTLSGFVDTSAIWNLDNGANTVPGRSFDGTGKQDGINLNVVGLSLSSPMDEGAWAAGYNVELWLGPDANGYGTSSVLGGGATADFAVKQANIDLRVPVGNGLEVKVGVFDTIVGYEVANAGGNPNYSRSYGYFIEPFAHTGVLASYQVNDVVGLVGGVAETSIGAGFPGGNAINNRSGNPGTKTLLGGIAITAPEGTGFVEGATLFAGIVDSGLAGPGNPADIQHIYVGGSTPTPVDGLDLGVAWDYQTDAVATIPGGGTSDQWALAGYASFKVPDSKLTLNGRVEYAKSETAAIGAAGTGFGGTGSDELFAVTVTADYSLWSNVISRLELRYDNADDPIFGGAAPGAGDTDDAFSLALNLIYQF